MTESSLQLDPGGLGTPPPGLKRLTLAFTDSVIERSYQLVAGAANTRDLVVGFLLGTGLWVLSMDRRCQHPDQAGTPAGDLRRDGPGQHHRADRGAPRPNARPATVAGGWYQQHQRIALLLLAEQALYFGRLAVPAVMLAALFAFVALRLRF